MTATTTAALLGVAPPGAAPRCGVVSEFDDHSGLGVVRVDGVGELAFHCTAIADGTRTITSGATVVCRIGPAHLGAVEAIGLVAVGSAEP